MTETACNGADMPTQHSALGWVGAIPRHWQTQRLKTLLSRRVAGPFGSALTKDMYVESGYRVYGQEQVIADDFAVGDYFIPEERFQALRRFAVRPGDVLVTCVGTIGRVAVVPDGITPGVINPRLVKLTPQTERIGTRYLAALLRARVASEQLARVSRGGTMDVLNLGLLDDIVLPVPPLAEQVRIAAFLDRKTAAIDQLIQKKERLIELLQEKRQALITQAVTKGLDQTVPMKDSGVEWLGQIPAHWEATRVRFHVSLSTSGSRGWSDYLADDGPLFLQSGNVDSNLGLDLRFVQHVALPQPAEGARTRVQSGDVLVCITGALTGNVAGVQSDLGEAYVNQHLCLLRPRAQSLQAAFLTFVLKSEVGQQQFGVYSYGLKIGLGLENVGDVAFARPPRDEQDEIARALDQELRRLLEVSRRVGAQLTTLREYRQAVISAAVTGQIDVTGEAA